MPFLPLIYAIYVRIPLAETYSGDASKIIPVTGVTKDDLVEPYIGAPILGRPAS